MKLLLFFSSLFGLLSFNPEPLVAEVGIGNDEYLQLDNSSIISNDVDWDEEGSYSVVYYDNKIKEPVNRMVHIIPSDFENLGYFENTLIHKDDYETMDMLESSDGYYICGSIPSNDDFEWTTLPQSYGFIAYIDNAGLIWEITFFDEYSYVSSIIIIDEKIYALLTIEYNNGSALKLLEIQDGNINRELILANDRESFGDKMILINNRLFIHCSSDSRYGDLSYIENCEYIGILEIDYKSFKVINSHCFGNPGINKIIKLDYDDKTIALVIRINAFSGPFVNINGGYMGNFLFVFDLDLQMIEYRNITYVSIREFFITPIDYVVIVGESDDISAWIEIVIMFRNFNYEQVFRCDIPGSNSFVYDAIHTRNEEGHNFIGINTYNRTSNKKKFIGVVEFTNDYFLKETAYYPIICEDFYLNDIIVSKTGMLLVACKGDNELKIDNFFCLDTKDNYIIGDDNEIHYSKSIFLNGKRVGILGEQENPIFGYHKDLYPIDDFVDIYLINSYYIPSKINIRNNQIYDSGINICFNGIGILNGNEISNSYIIEEVGEYSLIVHGVGEEREIVNFKVEELSLVDKSNEASEFKVNNGELFSSPIGKNRITFENYLSKYYENNGIIITIIIVLSFIVLAIFPKIKSKRKKK